MVASQQEDFTAVCDRRLHGLLSARGAEVDREIERLIVTEVRPVKAAILGRYGRSGTLVGEADLEDLAATIDLRLVETLRAIRDQRHDAVQDLRKYAATLTYNAVNAYLRKRYPERARLKNRVRYALTNDPRLAMWNADRGPAGGLRRWEGRDVAPDHVPADTPVGAAVTGDSHAEALLEIFESVRRPVLVDALADFLQSVWDLADISTPGALPEDLVLDAPDAGARAEELDFARALWLEIRELRPLQRKALLLNLRYDGDPDMLPVLILSGVTTLQGIAEALEVSPEELLAMWKELPLEDARIADILGVTRQQVINLRKAARERLSRRLPR